MRVGIVCPYAWDRYGGVQSHIRALGEVLTRRGHEVGIFAPRVSDKDLDEEEGVMIVGRAVGIPANGSVAPLAFGPLAAAGMRKALKAFDPEVLHLHEPLIPSLSLIALWNSEAPAVGTFHAAAESSFGYQAGRPALRRAMRRLAARTTVSDAARELIARYFPGDYELTPNGVDVARFSDAEPLELPGEIKVLFLGRIEKRKGLEVLIQAMARLEGSRATLVVAGTGPEERRCRNLAESLGVRASFVGRLTDEDLPRAYRAADVYCAPGLGGESFGIVLAEAMAAGAPVVCSDLAGFRAVVGDAAVVVPPGDPGALAGALSELLLDPAARSKMSHASSERARRYDWSVLVEHVEAVYSSAVAAPEGV